MQSCINDREEVRRALRDQRRLRRVTRKHLSAELLAELTMTDSHITTADERKADKRAADREAAEPRRFVVWDGEGAHSERQTRRPQDYVLLGAYNGETHDWITAKHLNTYKCLNFIIKVGKENPGALHVSFAFGYDVEEILRSLSERQFEFLRARGYVRLAGDFRVEHVPGKWFRVTQYLAERKRGVKTPRVTVQIFDTWGYWQSSLVNALKTTIADHPLMRHMPQIEEGKKRRADFKYKDIDYIVEYWKIENELFHAAVTRLREMLMSVGINIRSWHGPGSLANYAYSKNGIGVHKADCGPEIYDAARYAYAGGRIERFKIGRFVNVYGYDINSAYPTAISRLPSLSEGTWTHNDRPDIDRLAEFGVYRVEMRGPAIKRTAAPLFHRDATGNITFPWRLAGWYWTPEVQNLRNLPDTVPFRIVEGYEYTGWETRPFGFVADMYEERRRLKAAGDGSQMALKLCLNSLYGKMAQRAGWQRRNGAPRWHQLEWAGWVTSYTRASLWTVINRIPWEKVIAVETDGLYTTATPEELGITNSKELGGWEVTAYDEMIYLQSGLYAKRENDEWSIKFRGLDRETVESLDPITGKETAQRFIDHAQLLVPGTLDWPKLTGKTTRFVGYRNALWRQEQNRGPMKTHHCVWETEPREIDCGSVGKRIHSPKICAACATGAVAYDMAHETVVKSKAMLGNDTQTLMSTRHDIPWLDHEGSRFAWREKANELDGLIAP